MLKKRKGRVKQGVRQRSQNRKLNDVEWSLQVLKSSVVEMVVLAHPDFTCPFMLSTNASLDGIGTVLSQIPEGEETARLIPFANKIPFRELLRILGLEVVPL